mmetsp:Transcript_15017/g.50382  ORF Transcript_15017/g.50382 Transcript_15017/m.50382 type:complete len:434 (+) Transcript_15017:1187-2488(+)
MHLYTSSVFAPAARQRRSTLVTGKSSSEQISSMQCWPLASCKARCVFALGGLRAASGGGESASRTASGYRCTRRRRPWMTPKAANARWSRASTRGAQVAAPAARTSRTRAPSANAAYNRKTPTAVLSAGGLARPSASVSARWGISTSPSGQRRTKRAHASKADLDRANSANFAVVRYMFEYWNVSMTVKHPKLHSTRRDLVTTATSTCAALASCRALRTPSTCGMTCCTARSHSPSAVVLRPSKPLLPFVVLSANNSRGRASSTGTCQCLTAGGGSRGTARLRSHGRRRQRTFASSSKSSLRPLFGLGKASSSGSGKSPAKSPAAQAAALRSMPKTPGKMAARRAGRPSDCESTEFSNSMARSARARRISAARQASFVAASAMVGTKTPRQNNREFRWYFLSSWIMTGKQRTESPPAETETTLPSRSEFPDRT